MAIRVAINGFGRIGRLVFRVLRERQGYEVVAINDLANSAALAHLCKYDTVHGRYPGTVEAREGAIVVDGVEVKTLAERDPRNLPWGDMGVDFCVESTGVFSRRADCMQHVEAGAKKVLLTVPPKDEIDAMVVMGVNDGDLRAEHKVISNASCTTNCLAPVAKVLHDTFGIERGLMTTVHAYTNDQRIADMIHSDMRRARAGAQNIIPTTTGAARAVGKVIPALAGKLDGFAMRVPVPDGSVVDLVANLGRAASVDEINAALKAAADGPMQGILAYTEDPIVSSDVIHDPHSSIVDGKSTMACDGGQLVKVVSWYDNEWGYSNRVVDLLTRAHELGELSLAMDIRRLADLDVRGKRVLVRVDFNVPLDAAGRVTSDARIRAALPTIRAILAAGGRPILMSHLGRPDGAVVESMRLRPAAARLAELLGAPVHCARDCVGRAAERAVAELEPGAVLVLENLRFHPEETAGDPAFARRLAALGDIYVNDAFGTSHRAHASVAGVAEHLPAAAGLLLEREIDAFAKVLREPERPFVAILGGAKVSDKLPVILHLLDKVDALLIGGAMAYTFLAQAGVAIGTSRCEPDLFDEAARVRALATERGVDLLLPDDHVCAAEFAADAPASVHGPAIPAELMGLDIGPASVARFVAAIAAARTVIWNGPMGVFEMPAFRAGTEAVARAVAEARAFTVVGGGDSVAAVELLGVADRIGHVSTGGGASLELLEGKTLPGIAAVHA